jgi:1,4-dihydroxy-2-naphthoate octaprenyltransferase
VRALLAFLRLSRPLFLYGGVAGVALGAAVARHLGHPIDLAGYLWAQGLVSAFHLMVHYANDYFDRASDAHGDRGDRAEPSYAAAVRGRHTPWAGGSGVLVSGELPPRVALIAALVCAALGLAATAHFALAGNRTVGGLGSAILVFAWCYSAPPLRLAARGLGELDTALVVAVLVPCTGFAAFAGRIEPAMLTATFPCALAMLAMMLAVEMPDAGADYLAGKRNLVVRWGVATAYVALTALSIATVAALLPQARAAAGPPGLLAAVPAVACAVLLYLQARRGDWRPSRAALLGVALYATTVTGLAAAFAAAPG